YILLSTKNTEYLDHETNFNRDIAVKRFGLSGANNESPNLSTFLEVVGSQSRGRHARCQHEPLNRHQWTSKFVQPSTTLSTKATILPLLYQPYFVKESEFIEHDVDPSIPAERLTRLQGEHNTEDRRLRYVRVLNFRRRP
ncbi:hypothetical protein IL306_009805, partial [Fusarium sp. DS 682]